MLFLGPRGRRPLRLASVSRRDGEDLEAIALERSKPVRENAFEDDT